MLVIGWYRGAGPRPPRARTRAGPAQGRGDVKACLSCNLIIGLVNDTMEDELLIRDY